MKTIALKERTFNLLKDLKSQMRSRSFDKIVLELVIEKKNVPQSMFGELKGKSKPFSKAERNKLWEDVERE